MEPFKKKLTGLLLIACLLLAGAYSYQFTFSSAFSPKLQASRIKYTRLLQSVPTKNPHSAISPKSKIWTAKKTRAASKQRNHEAASINLSDNNKLAEKDGPQVEEAGRESRKEGEKRPDRPDLAFEQDFLRTMDPALRRPTPELLSDVIKKNHPSSLPQAKATRMPGDNSSVETNWKELGPNNVGGRTRALTWDPNIPNKVWAGGVSGGLWFNDDITSGTSSWFRVDDFWATLSVTKIVFDPTNPLIAYVSTGEGFGVGKAIGAGIWKTTDGGTTWSQIPSTANFNYINDLAVRNETGVSVIYAAVDVIPYEGSYLQIYYSGLQRSIDGGLTWSQVLPRGANNNPYVPASIGLNASGSRIWVGTKRSNWGGSDPGGGRVFYSDNGTSWTKANELTYATGGRVTVACAPSNDNYIYSFIENTKSDGTVGTGGLVVIRKSADNGATWSDLAKPDDADRDIAPNDFTRGQAWYNQALAVDPTNAQTLLIGGIDLFRYTDAGAGASWSQISKWSNNNYLRNLNCSEVHADQHAISFKPGSATDVVFGNDGGVFYTSAIASATASNTIAARNNNYNVTQFYSAAIHPTTGINNHLAGAQDNGTQQFNTDGINSTVEVSGGDGGYCFIDQNNPSFQITSYVYNNFYRSTDGGSNFSNLLTESTSTATSSFINPACYDNNLHILYTYKSSGSTNGSIYRVKNITTTPVTATVPITKLTSAATAFKVSPFTTSSTTLFIGTADGKLIKVTNANGTPVETDITGTWARPVGAVPSISCIALGRNENELLVTFFNYGTVNLWYSLNGGASWASKMGNFPNMPIRWALFNPNHAATEVLLATELGVYGTENFNNGSPSWTAKNTGFANVRTDMLQMRASDYQVIAATHGRGLFSSMGFSEAAAPTIVSFTPANAASGETVTITGTNLTGATEVSFGGTAVASFTVSNSTTISAVVSSGNCGSVSATTPGGVATKSGFEFILPAPVASVTTQPTCNVATGTISVSSSTTGLSFSINGSDYTNTSGSFSAVAPGTYNITARNANGCTSAPLSITVNVQPAAPTTPVGSVSAQPTCTVATGTIAVSSPTTGLNFSINGLDYTNTSGSFSAVAPGTYNITARNADGCTSAAASVTVAAQPSSPVMPVASVTVQPTCTLFTGTITVSSAFAGLTYSIDATDYTNTSGIFSAVAPGPYTLTARNSSGCISASASVTVNAPPPIPAAPSIVSTHPTCTVAAGAITISSATSGLAFSLDGVNYTNTVGVFTAIASGNYTVTARNSSGCTSSATSATVNAPPEIPAAPTASVTVQPTCTVATGAITVSSATTGLTFSIDATDYTNTTGRFSAVAPASYNVTAKNSSGCISSATGVTVNAQPTTPDAPTAIVSTQPTCSVATGTIAVSSSTVNLAFSIDGINYSSTNGIFTTIAPGTYNLSARNSRGCTSTATGITVNAQPASPDAPVASITAQPTCTVATGTITVSSPTTGLSFSLNAANYSNTTGIFANVAPGNYTVTAINNSGCTKSSSIVIMNVPPEGPNAPIATVTAQPTCTVATGTITVSSPTAGFTFSIDGANYTNSNGIFTGLAPGTYPLTSKNTSGCTGTATDLTVAPQPTTPAVPTANVTAQPTCSITTGTITIGSSTADLTFIINGISYSNTNGILTNIAPGTFNLTAKNSSGCSSAAASITVNVPPTGPSAPVAMVAIEPTCTAKGTIMVNSVLSDLRFSIDGIDFSNTTGIFTNVGPGAYTVVAKNTIGCAATSANITVSAPPSGPAAPSASVTAQPTCTVATGTVTVSSPIIGLTFSMDGTDYSNTNGIFTNIAAGAHSLTARNTIGCISTATSVLVTEQPTVANNTITLSSAAATNAQTTCIHIPIANITYATRGVSGAEFSGLPAGVSGTLANNVVTISGAPTVAGTFNYTVTLTGGCIYLSAAGLIRSIPNNIITLSSSAGSDNQANCANTPITPITYSTLGATAATFSGLPEGVTGQWSANVVTISGSPAVAGTYNYTVTLDGGCGNITATGNILAKAIASSPSIKAGSSSFCPGGSMILSSNALTGNQWYKDGNAIAGANGTTYAANSIGSYTLSNFTDGCTSYPSAATIITTGNIASPPILSASGALLFCLGGTVTLASNLTTGIQWLFNGSEIASATSATYAANAAGSYSLLVTENGCTSAAITVNILASPNRPILAAATATSFCLGGNVTLNSNETNGNRWYKDGVFIAEATGSSYTASMTGAYTDTLINSAGCKAGSLPINVSVRPAPAKPVITWNGSNLSTISSASAFQWSVNNVSLSGATQSFYRPLTIGFYKILVANPDGCTNISDSFNLVVTALNNPASTSVRNLASVFPNPASPVLLVKFREAPNTTLDIRLVTNEGRTVLLVKTKDKLTSIPIDNLPSGKYYIRITGNQYNQTEPVIIGK